MTADQAPILEGSLGLVQAALMQEPAQHWALLTHHSPSARQLIWQAPFVHVPLQHSLLEAHGSPAPAHWVAHTPFVHEPLQHWPPVVQAAADGWQQSARQVPDRQFPVQQSIEDAQAAPAGAHDAEQEAVPFRILGPALPFPAGPSSPELLSVTMNQNRCPDAGFSGQLAEVAPVVAACKHESFAGFLRQLMLGTSPR